MIVTNSRPRRRSTKPAQPAKIDAPRIVQHAPKWGRGPKPLAPDAEADARVAAFFRRMGITRQPKD